MFGLNKCKKGVHSFKPRFDRVAPEWMGRVSRLSGDVQRGYEDIYVKDVCVRCGAEIKRSDPVK